MASTDVASNTSTQPGSAKRLLLAVWDIDAARADLVSRGIEISGVFHLHGGPVPGPEVRHRDEPGLGGYRVPGIPLQGVPTEVRPACGSNQAEDPIVPAGRPEPVSAFYAEGMVSAAVNAPACARRWRSPPTRTRA